MHPGVASGCEEVQLLLPWYANGTLEPAEQAEVEAHLEVCTACRLEAEGCREHAAAVRGAEPLAPSPHPVQLSRLLARIEAAERQVDRGAARPLSSRFRRWFGGLRTAPAALRWALAAQLAVIVGLAGTLAWEEPAPPSQYRTLSDAPREAPAARLRLLFAEDATELEIRRLLLPLRADIAGGPSPLGAYTVRLPVPTEGGDPVSVVLAHLRSRPEVRFAEALGD
jgi:hypothetical protein